MKKLTTLLLLLSMSVLLKAQNSLEEKVNHHLIPIYAPSVADSSFEDLMPLKEKIGDSRVVFIGEAAHNFGNMIEMNCRIAQFLIQEMDFDYILFESGFYDLQHAQEKIEKGANVYDELNTSLLEIWSAVNEFQPLVKEIEKRKVKVGGFDYPSRIENESVFYDLKKYLSAEVEESVILDWYDAYITMIRYELPNDMESYQNAYAKIRNAIIEKKGSSKQQIRKKDFWLRVVDAKHDFFLYLQKYPYVGSVTKEDWKVEYAQPRDDVMAQNALWHIQQNPDAKFILWGATGHVSDHVKSIKYPDYNSFNPMGSQVIEHIGRENVSILATTSSLPDIAEQENYCLEHALQASNHSYSMLPLQSFDSLCYGNALGLEPLEVQWNATIDVLFYADTLRRSTLYQPPLDTKKGITYTEMNEEVDTLLQHLTDVKELTNRTLKKEVYLYKTVSKKDHQTKHFSGTVIDEETKEAIPFVGIGIPEEHIGVSSAEDGGFSIDIPLYITEFRDSLMFSCLGYKKKNIAFKDLSSSTHITLIPDVNELAVLTIRDKPISAKKVMRNVRRKLSKNYYQNPFTFQALYKSRIYDAKNDRLLLVETLAEKNDRNGYGTKGAEHIERRCTSVTHAQITQLNTATGEKLEVNNKLLKKYKILGGCEITEPVGGWGTEQEKHLFLAPRICPINFQQYSLLNSLRKRHYEFQLLSESDTHFEVLATATIEKNTHFYNTMMWFTPTIFQVKLKINIDNYAIEQWEQLAIYPNDKEKVMDVNTNYFVNIPKDCRYQKDKFTYQDPENDGKYHITYWSRYNTYSNYTFNEGIILNFQPNKQVKLGKELAYKKNRENTEEFWKKMNLEL